MTKKFDLFFLIWKASTSSWKIEDLVLMNILILNIFKSKGLMFCIPSSLFYSRVYQNYIAYSENVDVMQWT